MDKENELIYEPTITVYATPKQVSERLESTKTKGVYKDKISGKLLYNYDEMPAAEVVGHKKKKSVNDYWQEAYAKGTPSGTMSADLETANAVTGGTMNLLSPSQIVGAAIHSDRPSDYFLNLMKGNNGIVTDKFNEEHPYWSMATNGIFDAATLGLIGAGKSNVRNTVNYAKQKSIGNAAGIYLNGKIKFTPNSYVRDYTRGNYLTNRLNFKSPYKVTFDPNQPLYNTFEVKPNKFNPDGGGFRTQFNDRAVIRENIGETPNKLITIQRDVPNVKNGHFIPFKPDSRDASNFEALWWQQNSPYYNPTTATKSTAIIAPDNSKYYIPNTTSFGNSPKIKTTGKYPINKAEAIRYNPITGFYDEIRF